MTLFEEEQIVKLDIDAFVTYMTTHALPTASHYCARFVRLGLAAGGLKLAAGKNASDYLEYLPQLGFKTVWSSEVVGPFLYAKGDIVVFNKNTMHQYGHIQVWTGSAWVSDFVQKHFSPWSAAIPAWAAYRYDPSGTR